MRLVWSRWVVFVAWLTVVTKDLQLFGFLSALRFSPVVSNCPGLVSVDGICYGFGDLSLSVLCVACAVMVCNFLCCHATCGVCLLRHLLLSAFPCLPTYVTGIYIALLC